VLKTGRAGFAAAAGHDLTIEITSWSAQVEVPDEDGGGVTAATVTARLDLGSLAVREGSGGAKPLSDSDRREPVRLQVTESQPGKYRGSATIQQTAFGIKPYTGFFGALKLKDEVGIEFEVDLNQAAS
jgi:hypothetical protein